MTPRNALEVLRRFVLASFLVGAVVVPLLANVSSASAARTPSCKEPHLKFANRSLQPALSNVADIVEITNVSASACTITGFANVALTTAASPTPVVAMQRRTGYFGGVSPSYKSKVLPVFSLSAHTGTASFIVEESNKPLGSATSCPVFTKLSFTIKGFDFTYSFPVRLPACVRPGVLPIVKGTRGSWGF
jgi:hypothetical protein